MTTTQLAAIGLKAIEHDQAVVAHKNAQSVLTTAYQEWKDEHGIGRIERGTPEWEDMLKATRAEYLAVAEAERIEKNAGDRLRRACRRSVQ